MQEIKTLIDSFGFPVTACVAMGIFIYKMYIYLRMNDR